jgi:hypothetical protein
MYDHQMFSEWLRATLRLFPASITLKGYVLSNMGDQVLTSGPDLYHSSGDDLVSADIAACLQNAVTALKTAGLPLPSLKFPALKGST